MFYSLCLNSSEFENALLQQVNCKVSLNEEWRLNLILGANICYQLMSYNASQHLLVSLKYPRYLHYLHQTLSLQLLIRLSRLLIMTTQAYKYGLTLINLPRLIIIELHYQKTKAYNYSHSQMSQAYRYVDTLLDCPGL